MLACPAIVLASVFTVSHTGSRKFESLTMTPSQDAAVMAYAPYVKATNKLQAAGENADSRDILALGKKWCGGIQSGALTPLAPISFEDSLQDGARGSIFRAKASVVDLLLKDAMAKMDDRQPHAAADEVLLAMGLTESLKYCDFHTVFNASIEEEREVGFLRANANLFDTATKQRIHAMLTTINSNTQDLEELTRMSRIQYNDYVSRMNQQPISIEDVHRTVYVTKRVAGDPKGHDMMRYIADALNQTVTDSGPEYLSDLRLAWAADDSTHELLAKTLKEI